MISLLIIICIAIIIISFWWRDSYNCPIEPVCSFAAAISIITFCICGIIWLYALLYVSDLRVIDEKIELYQIENESIEEQIDSIVNSYMNYELDIFSDLHNENIITLVSTYPELKSDTLVQQQLEVYVNNNNTIKELEKQKINGKVYKWWLYFGG